MVTKKDLRVLDYSDRGMGLDMTRDRLRHSGARRAKRKLYRLIKKDLKNINIGSELREPIQEFIKKLVNYEPPDERDYDADVATEKLRKESEVFDLSTPDPPAGTSISKRKLEEHFLENDIPELAHGISSLLKTIIFQTKAKRKKKVGFNKDKHFSTHLYNYIDDFPDLFRRILNHPLMNVGSFDRYEKLLKLSERKYATPEVLLAEIKDSPLYDFFHCSVPIVPIPLVKRFEHMHVVAKTGHGKTQALHHFIYDDIQRALKNKAGFCIIDRQTDLIDTVSHLAEFDPQVKGSLADRVIMINPADVAYPVCLNLFDINLRELDNISDVAEREKAYSFATAIYSYIFSDLVEGKLTMYQTNIFQYCATLLMAIPDANILTFYEFLKDEKPYIKYYNDVDDTTRIFFESEYHTATYKSTKEQIRARLSAILRNRTLRNMFTNKKNKINILEAMDQGKIVFINTSKMMLQSDGAKLLGKFFIALILQSCFQRANTPEDKRKPFFVYIDEAHDYMTDTMAEFLNQTRKYKVGIIMAHQFLKQLDDISTNLRHATTTNTTIKLYGNLSWADARALSRDINIEPEEIGKLKKVDYGYTEYFLYISYLTDRAIKARVPLGVLNKKKRMSKKSYKILQAKSRAKYSKQLEGDEARFAEIIDQPDQADEGTETQTKAGFKLGKKKKL